MGIGLIELLIIVGVLGMLMVGLLRHVSLAGIAYLVAAEAATAATVQERYYAHPAVHDRHGVIAPWYRGQNGPCDFRVRIAAETLKRYPWVAPPQAVSAAPHYVFNGHWKIDPDGTITPVPISDWDNGDLGQRAAYVLSGLVDYYRYSGDPAAIAHLTWQADALLNHCLTPDDHPWPRFLISVPTKGKPYGACDPSGMIQLDIVAEVGLGLLRAYQVTGNAEWFEACRHWGDLLAAKRNRRPGEAPWGRYANPESSPWKDDKQTGGVVFLLYFFDELIRLGHRGTNDEIVQARDAGRAWLRDELLPHWTVNDVWGRNYWDWADPVQAENVTEFAARYLMDNKEHFPNWRTDARNILSLFLNHTSVCPKSAGEVYSGAWAFPESCGCCGRSLWYGPMELAVPFAQLGVEAQDPWATELARRMQILATYDGHETGVSEDNIDGGFVVNNGWFKIAHPMALKHLLATIAWMPECFAPARENHLVRSTAVVDSVTYVPGGIDFSTFDAPPGTTTVLRLAFEPELVQAVPDAGLPSRADLTQNGYLLKPLPGGDCLVTVRHDGIRQIRVAGGKKDPAMAAAPGQGAFALEGAWSAEQTTADNGASMTVHFSGNQVRLTGDVGPDGGLAEVYLDERQAAGRHRLLESQAARWSGGLLSQWAAERGAHAQDRRLGQRQSLFPGGQGEGWSGLLVGGHRHSRFRGRGRADRHPAHGLRLSGARRFQRLRGTPVAAGHGVCHPLGGDEGQCRRKLVDHARRTADPGHDRIRISTATAFTAESSV